jgi:hypothetical protein
MKTAARGILVVALAFGLLGAGTRVEAGDHEWAVAGKVLAGLFVLDALTRPHCSTTVVYEQPVVYHPPVVQYYPPVVYQPPVVVHRPVVYHHPVRYGGGVSFHFPTHRGPSYPRRSVYRTGFRRGSRAGYWHGAHGRRW